MRGVLFSDAHVDWRTRGFDRAEDVLGSIDKVVDAAVDLKADVLVFGGDLAEGQDPDERTYTLLAEVDARLSRFPGKKVLVAGNHDVVDRAGWRSSLATLEGPNCVVVERPAVVQVTDKYALLAMPHVSKAHVGTDPQEYLEARARHLIADFRAKCPGGRLVAVCHYDPPGAMGGSEEEMQAGERLWIPDAVLRDATVQGVLCGHVHMAQSVPRFPGYSVEVVPYNGWDPMVRVVGSLQRLTHAEEGHPKGYLVFDTAIVGA